jgi:hypothetical protein
MEAEVPWVSALEVAVERHQIPSHQPSHRMSPLLVAACRELLRTGAFREPAREFESPARRSR